MRPGRDTIAPHDLVVPDQRVDMTTSRDQPALPYGS